MYLAVSGNIGAGKSTLVTKLAKHYHGRAVLETVTDNPYLNDFYDDMARWAFPLQIYFLNQRFRQGLQAVHYQGNIILDRTIYEDADIFALNLRQLGHLSERDYQNYRGLYVSMRDLLPSPDLVIYLRGSVPTLQQRISHRMTQKEASRQNEDKIPSAYLAQLNQRYDAWVDSFTLAPVLTVDIDTVDLSTTAFDQLIGQINRTLRK